MNDTREKAIEAAARREAEIDGRPFDKIGRVERERYIMRTAEAITAYEAVRFAEFRTFDEVLANYRAIATAKEAAE